MLMAILLVGCWFLHLLSSTIIPWLRSGYHSGVVISDDLDALHKLAGFIQNKAMACFVYITYILGNHFCII
ncbi:hypothetical protein QBC34DRAFT_388389, partial [Podospora aff. communis PSN243]